MLNPFKLMKRIAVLLIVVMLVVGWLWYNGYLTTQEVIDGSGVAKEQVVDGFTQLKSYIPDNAGDKTKQFAECVINGAWGSLSDSAKVSIAKGSTNGIQIGDAKALSFKSAECLMSVVGK